MNPTLDVLRGHRSIRTWTDDPVLDADVHAAVEAGQRASTSSAVQAYCLIRVRDVSTRARLVALTGGQEKVARAGAFFVVCGDVRRHRRACARERKPYDTRLEAFLVAVVDASLFAQNVCIAFESMGYGLCYVGGLRNQLDDVDRLLQLPEGVYPLYGLCVGRPAEDPLPRPRLPLEGVLFEERYPDDTALDRHLDAQEAEVAAYYARRGLEPRAWTAQIAAKHAAPQREPLADYYRGKGANLD